MKDEATPEQLAMARRIAAEQIGWPTYEDAAAHNHHTDEYASVALAAIIETTELAAKYAHDWRGGGSDLEELAYDLRSGDHLKGQDHG